MKRLNVAVIGTGFWGENQVRVLRQLPDCNLIGVCDTNEKRARQVGTKYHVPWFTNPRKLLSLHDLEAVTVCTPTHTHLKVGLAAVEAGKSLLVEKPMTGEQQAATTLTKAAAKKGIKLLVGFIERFNPGVALVSSMLKKRAVGDVIIATGRRVARLPIRIGDVGVVKDTAIHDIDVMRHLLGENISSVYAQIGSLKHSFEDYAELMLQFKGGKTGFIDANWLTPRKVRTLIITGSEATLSLDYITQEVTLENSTKLVRPHAKWDEPLRIELEHFIEATKGDFEPSPSGEDALEAIRVCDAALESGRNGRVVRL